MSNGKFMITTRSLNLTINDPKLDHKNATWAPNSIQVSAFAQSDAFYMLYFDIFDTRATYQVVSLNTPMADSSKFDMKYLLKRPEPPSTTTTTTTSKPVHPDQFLEVFVLIVNEQDFVMNNNSEKFRDAVWKIFTE